MNVRPIDLAGLPRVGALEAAATRAVARALAALPSRVEVRVPPFGPVSLAYAGIDAPAGTAIDQVAFGLFKGGRSGRLLFDATFAHALVAAVLGDLGTPPSLRRLGVGERGILAGIVAAVLDGLGVVGTLSLSPLAGTPGGLALAIEARVGDHGGRIVLEVPPEWLREPSGAPQRLPRAGRISLAVSLEVAVTELPASELAALAVGDAVVFDGVAALPPDFASSWPVRVNVGGYAAPASLGAEGKVTLQGGFDPAPPLAGDAQAGKEIAMERSGASASTVAILAAAPIEVIAELGRITLRGDEVLGLAPGTVLSFAARVPGAVPAVRLRIGGEVWAEGELVDVDGALGVRVTTMKRP